MRTFYIVDNVFKWKRLKFCFGKIIVVEKGVDNFEEKLKMNTLFAAYFFYCFIAKTKLNV
jgi:hypothetical protein